MENRVVNFVLLLERANEYGTARIKVSLCRTDAGIDASNSAPLGCNGIYQSELPKSLQGCHVNGISMHGHTYESSDGDKSYIGFEPQFYNAYSIDLADAKRMVRTLTRFTKVIKTHKAKCDHELSAAKCFLLLAKFFKVSSVIVWDRLEDSSVPNMMTDKTDWNHVSVDDGFLKYHDWINEEKANHVQEI